MSREPPIEYAALGRRTAVRGQINRLERQRREFLLDRKLYFDLDSAEAAELAWLEYVNGTGPPAPEVPVKDGGCCDRSAPMSGREAQLATMAARWPAPRLTTRQKIAALWELRIIADMSPRQRAVWRMRRST
jgi:hypothetical protein